MPSIGLAVHNTDPVFVPSGEYMNCKGNARCRQSKMVNTFLHVSTRGSSWIMTSWSAWTRERAWSLLTMEAQRARRASRRRRSTTPSQTLWIISMDTLRVRRPWSILVYIPHTQTYTPYFSLTQASSHTHKYSQTQTYSLTQLLASYQWNPQEIKQFIKA